MSAFHMLSSFSFFFGVVALHAPQHVQTSCLLWLLYGCVGLSLLLDFPGDADRLIFLVRNLACAAQQGATGRRTAEVFRAVFNALLNCIYHWM